MKAQDAFVALNLLPLIGPVRVRQMLSFFGDDPAAILKAPRTQLERVQGIGPELAETIAKWESSVDLPAELQRVSDFGAHIVTWQDEAYPPLLRELYDPPFVLYVKGTLTAQDKNSVAMVGSRLTTSYGQNVARKLSFQLAQLGVTVVSGGARGIDTAAHQGAISGKGRTIAVLGTGINLVYPAENKVLFDQIPSNGALITQFPFNRSADRQSFPIRNRIVAGMTLGTVVVEANLTSGALITANMAVDAGRQVFAVPGPIDSPRSKGCHDLIKKGAKLCEGVEDILGEFEYLFPPSNRPATPSEAGELPALSLNENEGKLYGMTSSQALTVDELIQGTGLPAHVVNVGLLALEMKRLVKQMPGRQYVRLR